MCIRRGRGWAGGRSLRWSELVSGGKGMDGNHGVEHLVHLLLVIDRTERCITSTRTPYTWVLLWKMRRFIIEGYYHSFNPNLHQSPSLQTYPQQ